jgi:TetR/AcrR family transcriptional regulator, cholesterol catabolism regulator
MLGHISATDVLGSAMAKRRTNSKPENVFITSAEEKSRLPYPIVQAAAKLFRKHGFAGVSMREIADAVQLSKAGLYHHCPSKEGLLAEMMRVAGELLLEQLAATRKIAGSPHERIHAFLESRLQLVAEYRDLFAIIFQERPLLSGVTFGDVAKSAEKYRVGVRQLLQEAQIAGELRSDVDIHLLMLAIDGMTGWACLWYQPEGKQRPETIAEAFWSFLVQGVLSDQVMGPGAPARPGR